jgi:hypothetical protein
MATLEKLEECYNANTSSPTGKIITVLRPYLNLHPLYAQLQDLLNFRN